MEATYASHNVAKMAVSHFIPGAGEFASMAAAMLKCGDLEAILQRYFRNSRNYTGGDIDQNDVELAIKYVVSKKSTKSGRKAFIATAKVTAAVVGTLSGATLGSVIPVAGTAAGGAAGYVAGASVGTLVTAGHWGLRSMKKCYKWFRGTQGKHREQAAEALFYNATTQFNTEMKRCAAMEALMIILGAEFESVMAQTNPRKRIAQRLKSN